MNDHIARIIRINQRIESLGAFGQSQCVDDVEIINGVPFINLDGVFSADDLRKIAETLDEKHRHD